MDNIDWYPVWVAGQICCGHSICGAFTTVVTTVDVAVYVLLVRRTLQNKLVVCSC